MKIARLAVLGVALSAGAIAAMLMASSEPPPPPVPMSAPAAPAIEMDQVVVATRNIDVGAILKEGDIGWSEWPKKNTGAVAIRRSAEPDAIKNLIGAMTRAPFFQGEPLRRDKIIVGSQSGYLSAVLASGKRAVAINIDSSGANTAGGFILPNDRVDVLRVGGTDSEGETILSNIRVLAIGQNVSEKDGEKVITGTNATLEVTASQAETLIGAQRTGQLSLVLRSILDAEKNSKDTDVEDESNRRITVIRYGSASNKR